MNSHKVFNKPAYFIILSFLFLTPSLSQEVIILKNDNDELRVELKSPGLNTFVGDSAGVNTSGVSNVALGYRAMYSNTEGEFNTAVGFRSLLQCTMGSNNTAIGANALRLNSGAHNIGVGVGAMEQSTAGFGNIAIGKKTLNLTIGDNNVAIGGDALRNNSGGSLNIGIGSFSMYANSSGQSNIGIGFASLFSNSTGSYNTSIGTLSLYANSSGFQNTAVGNNALKQNTSGPFNVAIGDSSLTTNTSGERNVAVGHASCGHNSTGHSNTAVGDGALYYNTTGSYNTGIGRNAYSSLGYDPSNHTAIGYNSGQVSNNSNTVEIGNTSVIWIGGQQPWSTYSDARIKDNVRENIPGLMFINKLRPVSYNLNIHRQHEMAGISDTAVWEGKYDVEKIVQSGFIAQEVEQAAQETNYDFSGVNAPHGNAKLYSLQYSTFVVPLVKAVQELSAENTWLKEKLDAVEAQNSYFRKELILLSEQSKTLTGEFINLKKMLESVYSKSNGL